MCVSQYVYVCRNACVCTCVSQCVRVYVCPYARSLVHRVTHT